MSITKKNIKLPIKRLVTSIGLVLSFTAVNVMADTLAITHATIYTATEQGMLNDATIIVDDGKIVQIYPDTTAQNSVADMVIDAEGKIITPGFIGSMNSLGLIEVNAVADTRDDKDKKADITFDASLAFNPKSTLIAFSRKGGVTRNLVTPIGGEDVFKGSAFLVDLSGNFNSITNSSSAVVAEIGASSSGSRAYDLQQLINKFDDAAELLVKDSKASNDSKAKEKEVKKEDEIILSVLAGDKPLVVFADRATDMLALIALKERLKLKLIIVGAADAQLISEQLVNRDITLVLDAMRNLPDSFDSLHVSLDSAAQLTAAGVKVILSVYDSHNLAQLRYTAGNAIANGLSREAALASITSNVSNAFNLNVGKIAIGYSADLVLWTADPFEISSKVEKMWISGNEVSTYSRQDALRDRYTTESNMPRAYLK